VIARDEIPRKEIKEMKEDDAAAQGIFFVFFTREI
jgi:hypothetical protein